MNAPDLGRAVISKLEERGKEYDKPQGERSMEATIVAFNAITRRDLREDEGWLLLQLLKNVRLYTNTDVIHEDSVLDEPAYALLKGESWHRRFPPVVKLTTHATKPTPPSFSSGESLLGPTPDPSGEGELETGD